MADPIKIIKNDHRMVEKLFKEYEQLGDSAFKTKQDLARQICDLLKVHTGMEEEIMYPMQEEKFNDEGDKIAEEAYAEHEVVKSLIAAIEDTETDDPQFDAKVTVLEEVVSHHAKEEEDELLPKMMKEFSEQELDEMGDKFESFKMERE